MPRRRMIGPEFWDDEYVGKLTDTERVSIMGCLGNADDEGRLKGSGAYLKAAIFMYDDEKTPDSCSNLKQTLIHKMESWPLNHPYLIIGYQNTEAEYLCFPNWPQTNKPSHPTTSKLPPPPLETLPIFSSEPQEDRPTPSGDPPSQVSLGQSSLGKDRLGKVSVVQEDFTKLLDNEQDLTDYLTTTLTHYMPLGPTQLMPVIKKLWLQGTGREMSGDVFQVIYMSLSKYPLPVLVTSMVKSVKYSVGKRKPANYIQSVLNEQMKEYEKSHPP